MCNGFGYCYTSFSVDTSIARVAARNGISWAKIGVRDRGRMSSLNHGN
jgi:hypothetical protein